VIDLADIRAAAARLVGVTHRTPIITSRTLNRLVGAEVFLKAENLQRTGSFKLRGAYNAIAQLTEADRDNGVVAYSSGNHGQAVAYSASLFGVEASIVMPTDAPDVKKAAVAGYGATIVDYDRATEDRNTIATRIASRTGAALIPPFDNLNVMAGQGTCGLELHDDAGPLDIVMVCTGGGGLLAGCSTALAELNPNTAVYGVEPEASNDTLLSMEAGHVVSIAQPVTIADGQALTEPGELTFSVNRRLAAGIVTVSDTDIVNSMRFAFDRLRLVVEPSGATALAALLAGRLDVVGRRVGVTLSGGNVDRSTFSELLTHGVRP